MPSDRRLSGYVLVEPRSPWHAANDTTSNWRPNWNYQWSLKDKNVRGILFPDFDHAQILNRLRRIADALVSASIQRIYTCGSKVALLTEKNISMSTHLHRLVRSAIA